MSASKLRPPAHLKPKTRKWWTSVVQDFELQPHHLRLLTLAAESWDRCSAAREAIEAHGLTYVDRFGQPRSRPEVNIERDSRIAFVRCLRELDLDVELPPETKRPPFLQGYRGPRAA